MLFLCLPVGLFRFMYLLLYLINCLISNAFFSLCTPGDYSTIRVACICQYTLLGLGRFKGRREVIANRKGETATGVLDRVCLLETEYREDVNM